jgi:hypothetical protein
MSEQPETLTHEAAAKDPWAAVYLPLPANPSPELVKEAHWMAEYCFEAETSKIEPANSERRPGNAFAPTAGGFGDGIDPKTNADAALARMVELEKIDSTLERVGPHSQRDPDRTPPDGERPALAEAAKEITAQPEQKPEGRPYDGPPPAGLYDGAAHEVARTPADSLNQQLADVTRELAKTAGVAGTPEHAAFEKLQAERGDQITRTADPAERAELRNERDAAAHLYAAGLADKVGNVLDLAGQGRDADDLKKLADTHRQIADVLRGGEGGKHPPEGPTRPDGPGSPQDRASAKAQEPAEPAPERPGGETARREFAEAAKAAGQEALGKTAEVAMVAPGPDPIRPEDRVKESNITQNQAVQMVPTPSGTLTISGPQNRFARDADEPARPGELSRAPVGKVDEATAERGRDDSSKRQSREDGELRGSSSSSSERRQTAREALAEVRREAAKEREANDGPERPSGQGEARAAGRYASLGR